MYALTNDRIYNSSEIRDHHALVVVADGIIDAIWPADSLVALSIETLETMQAANQRSPVTPVSAGLNY